MNITTGALELNKVKKIHASKEKQLAEERAQVASLKRSNRELKVSMVQAMIERDELEARKEALKEKLVKKQRDIDGLDRQSGYILDSVAPPPPPPSSHKRQDTRTS